MIRYRNDSVSNKYLRQLVEIVALLLIVFAGGCSSPKKQNPNIIIIYVDDLGYGDIGCYGASNVKTPNVDYLASKGLKFTDAHCSASTCTPSRFALLTGIYAFRKKAAVLPGDASMLLSPGSETMPAALQKAGYTTAVVGKWHLGLGQGTIDWNSKIIPSPNETGFDYSFIIPATTDRVPTVYVENGKVPGLDSADPIKVSYVNVIGNDPTGLSNPEMLKMKADTQHSNTIVNGISRIGYMSGGKLARWKDEDIADVLTEKAVSFIRHHKDKPFFLYFSIPDIHVPRAPHPRFVGSTGMGKRGDVISEMDWMTGEIIKAINETGLTDNTLIIFSSDNGPVLDDGYADNAVELLGNHDPSGGFRGGKYSAFEAGTRVPTITYWPGTIKPGTSDAVWSQVDLFASLADLTDQQLSPGTGPDSENMLDVLLGKSEKGREYLLEESYTLSLRKDDWKYISPVENPTPVWLKRKRIESGLLPVPQLYNLKSDPGEKNNVAQSYPGIVSKLEQKLKMIKRAE
jgi:arylsulfatase A-like enzyme